jgi:hypothetical protein
MPPEVRGTALELVERFAIAGSYKNILTMQPAKQLSSHPERGESSGGSKCRPIICAPPRFWAMRRGFFAARF